MKSHKNAKLVISILVIVIIVGFAAGIMICKSLQQKPAAQSTSLEYVDFEIPGGELPNNGKLNICVVTKGYGNDYWDTLIQGAADSAAINDVNIYVAGVMQEGDVDRQAELLEKAYLLNPDAIIVSPQDTAKIIEIAGKIKEKGIPLIFVDTILNGNYYDACFMTDNMEAGRIVAKDMISRLRYAGHKSNESICVGIDIGSEKSQTIIERLAGFNEYWSNNAPDKWTIIDDIKVNGGSADVAFTQCLEFIDGNSNIAGLIGLNNGSTVGLCRGIVERQRKDIVLVGFDYSSDMSALIEEGEYNVATMVQLQYNMGYESVRTAIDICSGEKPSFKYYNTGVSRVDHNNYNSPYIKQNVLRK